MTSCRHCAVNGGEVGGGEHRGHSGPAPHLPTLPQIQVGLVALHFHIILNTMLSGVISLLPMSVWWILKLKLATSLNGTIVIFIWKMHKIVGIKNIYQFNSNLNGTTKN